MRDGFIPWATDACTAYSLDVYFELKMKNYLQI